MPQLRKTLGMCTPHAPSPEVARATCFLASHFFFRPPEMRQLQQLELEDCFHAFMNSECAALELA